MSTLTVTVRSFATVMKATSCIDNTINSKKTSILPFSPSLYKDFELFNTTILS